MGTVGRGQQDMAGAKESQLKLSKCWKSCLAEKHTRFCEKSSKSSNRHSNPVMTQIKSRNNFDQNF